VEGLNSVKVGCVGLVTAFSYYPLEPNLLSYCPAHCLCSRPATSNNPTRPPTLPPLPPPPPPPDHFRNRSLIQGLQLAESSRKLQEARDLADAKQGEAEEAEKEKAWKQVLKAEKKSAAAAARK
jgi:hypothetical protein